MHKARDTRDNSDVFLKRCRSNQTARKEFKITRDLKENGCRNVLELHVDRLVGDDEVIYTHNVHEFYKQVYDHPSNIVTNVYSGSPGFCITDHEIAAILFDTLTALADVHELGYIHRDVKLQNIMCDGTRHRMIDFGLAIKVSDENAINSVSGTPFYMAPEIIQNTCVTQMIDMYSLGVMAYELTHCGQHPVAEMNGVSAQNKFQSILVNTSYDTRKWSNEDAPLTKDLCGHLLHKYPMARLTAAEALTHPIFKDLKLSC